MKKIVLVPDSFKGTMTSFEVAQVMEKAILDIFPACRVVSLPVADGGEGSALCFIRAAGGRMVDITATGPNFQPLSAGYAALKGDVAVIESAACCGLPLMGGKKSPMSTTTFGVGEAIVEAAQDGAKKIIIALGGTATNDGGAGAMAAMGVKFYDSLGQSFVPVGQTLSAIESVDISALNPVLRGIDFVCMCDVENPLFGKNGAAFVFAPQKGATPEEVILLDRGLEHFGKKIGEATQKDIASLKGAGAAGGMAGGLHALLDAPLMPGIEVVLDAVGFEAHIAGADLIITGEGRVDGSSLFGKVPFGVAKRAGGVPVIIVAGDVGDGIEPLYNSGVSAIFSINQVAVPVSEARKRSKKDMAFAINNIMRLLLSLEKQ